MKKGLSVLSIILIFLILIVIGFILFVVITYFLQSKNLVEEVKINSTNKEINSSDKDLNYYLPPDFAAIKVTRGFFETKVTGVIISFEDDANTYDYISNESIGIDETRRYIILKDELNPEVPGGWDFSKVKFVSLKYLLENGNPSAIIKRTEINPDKMSRDFGESCSFTIEEGEKKISCE